MRASPSIIWGAFLSLVLLALVARYTLKSWLAPGALFALYWSGASLIPFFALPDDKISVQAVLWIFTSALMVLIGNYLGVQGRIYSPPGARWIPRSPQLSFLIVAIIGSVFLGSGVVITTIRDSGYSLRALFSPSELVAVARWFSVGRYYDTYSPPLLSQILLIFVYTGPMYGGALAAIRPDKRHWLISLLSLLPAVLIMMVRTQRGVVIIAGVLWFSAYLAIYCLLGRLTLFTKARVLAGTLLAVSTFFVFSLVALARAGTTDLTMLVQIYPKIASSAAGHMAIFSLWLEGPARTLSVPGLGRFTFAGVFDALGLYDRPLGLYQEFVVLSNGFPNNIYTIFRPLIEDFTLFGALLVLLFFGLVSGLAYQQVLLGSLRSVPLLVAFYATVLLSPYASLWTWNSAVLAFIIYSVSLWFAPQLVPVSLVRRMPTGAASAARNLETHAVSNR